MEVAAHLAQLLEHGVLVSENALGPLENAKAFAGETLKTLASHHDRDAELVFELADRGRQRWLRDVASGGGAAKVLFAGKGDQIDELFEDHDRLFAVLNRDPTPRNSAPPVRRAKRQQR
jgi:hypothetical protein